MDFFIKKIADGKVDELVHLQFQKYSRGEFKEKAMVKVKNSKGKYSVSTTPEYGNEFVRYFAEKLGNNKTPVTGVIVSTQDLSGVVDFSGKKQFAGVKQYIINGEMSGGQIIDVLNKLPKAFVGLSFKVREEELKIKPKAPKSGKPSTKSEEEPKIDFCKIKTSDASLVKSLLFDLQSDGFKEVIAKHDFIITDIVIPSELKNEKDFAVVREKSLRKGKIIRTLKVDEKETKKEMSFEA